MVWQVTAPSVGKPPSSPGVPWQSPWALQVPEVQVPHEQPLKLPHLRPALAHRVVQAWQAPFESQLLPAAQLPQLQSWTVPHSRVPQVVHEAQAPASQRVFFPQEPQEPPQPSSPHERPEHCCTQGAWQVPVVESVQVCPTGQQTVPQASWSVGQPANAASSLEGPGLASSFPQEQRAKRPRAQQADRVGDESRMVIPPLNRAAPGRRKRYHDSA